MTSLVKVENPENENWKEETLDELKDLVQDVEVEVSNIKDVVRRTRNKAFVFKAVKI